MRSGECNVVSLYVLCCPVNGSICFVCCVFDRVLVNCLVKQFAICLFVFVSLLLNVMELLLFHLSYQWSFRQKGRLNTVSCMPHIGSLRPGM